MASEETNNVSEEAKQKKEEQLVQPEKKALNIPPEKEALVHALLASKECFLFYTVPGDAQTRFSMAGFHSCDNALMWTVQRLFPNAMENPFFRELMVSMRAEQQALSSHQEQGRKDREIESLKLRLVALKESEDKAKSDVTA